MIFGIATAPVHAPISIIMVICRTSYQLGEMGELVYTKRERAGIPAEVVALNTGAGMLPWWLVLGVDLV